MTEKELEELQIELVTMKYMLYDLYNRQLKILKSISPYTKTDNLEKWESKCKKYSIEWFNKMKEGK